MVKKKKKDGQEPNLKVALAAGIILVVLVLFVLIDAVKDIIRGTPDVSLFVAIFMVGCEIGLLCIVRYIIKRMKEGK